MISSLINCSDYSSVGLYFSQLYRNYNSSCFIDVSNDGGQSWSRYQVNGDVRTNAAVRDSIKYIDISEDAAGYEEVRVKFVFDGDYYFWIIDDISLRTMPNNDLIVEDFFYPNRSFRTPDLLNDCDTLGFSIMTFNKGIQSQTDVEFKASILDESANEVFTVSETKVMVPSKQRDTINFSDLFIQEDLNPGLYTIWYEVHSDQSDAFPLDNVECGWRGIYPY